MVFDEPLALNDMHFGADRFPMPSLVQVLGDSHGHTLMIDQIPS